MTFTRARVTADSSPVDVALDKPVFFLWATGSEVDIDSQAINFHGVNRGASPQMILLPSAIECPFSGKIMSML